jgi:acetate kinase
MQVLVLNSGSSSIKYRLFGDGGDGGMTPGATGGVAAALEELAAGLIERIGESEGRLTHRITRGSTREEQVE